MGLFGKPKAKAAPPAQSRAMDYNQMVEFFGLPAGSSIRDDNCFFELYTPATTRLVMYENKPYQSVELINRGKTIAVMMSGKHIGDVTPESHREAVKALNTHGGIVAPATINQHRDGKKFYRILCPDGNKTK
jgi:hypothetical protein